MRQSGDAAGPNRRRVNEVLSFSGSKSRAERKESKAYNDEFDELYKIIPVPYNAIATPCVGAAGQAREPRKGFSRLRA